jgi:hypothetical protein
MIVARLPLSPEAADDVEEKLSRPALFSCRISSPTPWQAAVPASSRRRIPGSVATGGGRV